MTMIEHENKQNIAIGKETCEMEQSGANLAEVELYGILAQQKETNFILIKIFEELQKINGNSNLTMGGGR